MPVFPLIEDAVSENNQERVTVASTLYSNFYVADDGSLLVRAGFVFNGNNGIDQIPQGATITSAVLTVNRSASQDYSGGFQGDWRGYLVVNVSAFSGAHAHNLSAHEATLTTALVADDNWANAATHTSPSLVAIVQEIVNQASWPTGGEIGLFYDTTDGPTGWWAFADNSATLTVTWSSGAEISVGGTVAPSGALTKQPRRTLAGAVTPTGSALKSIARLLAGAVTPTGSVSNEISGGTTPISISGALTPTGALLRQVNKQMAGAVTPTGMMLKVIARLLAGQLAFGISPGSIRFYGTGYSGGTYDDEDRIVIPIDAPETKPAWATATGYDVDDYVANDDATYICTGNHTSGTSTEPGVGASWETVWDLVPIPSDIGAGNFCIEFMVRGTTANNDSTGAEQWINGNIIVDRDRFNAGRKFGISFTDGAAMFGVGGDLNETIVGSTNVLDDAWHHLAFLRQESDGRTWIMVDGVQDATGIQETGDQSYPDGVRSAFDDPNNRDHFLVLGAEKHDAGASYPSFNGYMAELRLSDTLRYNPAGFTPPAAPFTADANTVGLWHLDEGSGTTVTDSATVSGQRAHGTLNIGGPSNGPTWETDSPFAVSGGVLTLLVGLALSGVVAPAGAVAKAISRLFSGAVAPEGGTVRQAQLAPAGSVAPSGGLLRQVAKQVAGSLAPSGVAANVRTILLSVAGSLTPSGGVIRQAGKVLAGVVAPVGAVTKAISRLFGGGVTPSGNLTFLGTIVLNVAGSLTPNGTVGRSVSKLVGGVVAPTGAVAKAISRLVSGAVAPEGAVGRQVSKLLSGAVAPSGTAAHIISNVIALAGSLTPSGSVGRRVSKIMTGGVTPVGTITKRLSRLFSGSVSPSGLLALGETAINQIQVLAKGMFKAMFKKMR